MPPKPVTELTPDDLVSCPIWEFTLREKAVGPNQGTVRPRPDLQRHDPAVGTGAFAVRTDFILADGAEAVGYCSPVGADVQPEDHILGYLAPAIVTQAGHVPFWFSVDKEPHHDDVQPYYSILGRDPDSAFPVSFTVTVPVGPDEISSGLIEAFTFIVCERGQFKVVRIQ